MSFWSVQVIQNCNWNFDVEIDGYFDREISDVHELRVMEELSIIQDRICFFLSEFPGNIVWEWVELLKDSNRYKKIKDTLDHINGM